MGWVPQWEYRRDSISFQFTINHPGRKYYIEADLVREYIRVGKFFIVRISNDQKQVEIKTSEGSLRTKIIGFHR